jgi:hypothetical protein
VKGHDRAEGAFRCADLGVRPQIADLALAGDTEIGERDSTGKPGRWSSLASVPSTVRTRTLPVPPLACSSMRTVALKRWAPAGIAYSMTAGTWARNSARPYVAMVVGVPPVMGILNIPP